MPGLTPRLSAVAAVSLLLGALVPALPAAAAQELPGIPVQQAGPAPRTDRFIVKFKDSSAPGATRRKAAYDKAAGAAGTRAQEKRTTATGAKVIETGRELDGAEAAGLVDTLKARPDVEYAEPDVLLQPSAVPNDTYYNLQWDLFNGSSGMRLPGVWEKTTGAGTVVAVVDTGITAHPDLDANVLPGYDMISDAGMARDGNGRDPDAHDAGDACNGQPSSWHGTHVAGIIAAVGNNGKGVTGVAYGAKVLPVRALGACGGWLSDISDAVVWAAGGTVSGVPANPHPAGVINMSLGVDDGCSAAMQEAIDNATGRGAAVVVAAGNEDRPADKSSPANCEHVIAVAASGPAGNRAPYSNYGAGIDVTAPGGDMTDSAEGGIASTINSGTSGPVGPDYAYMEGTSMAAPHVAGLAALLLAADPALSPAAVEARMKATARPISSCNGACGAGLVDAAAALGVTATTLAAPTPKISGTAAVGSTLTAVPGTWTAGTKRTYQWYNGSKAIAGATSYKHKVAAGDLGGRLKVKVTGTLTGYTTVRKYSAATAAVVKGTLTSSKPVISGTVKVGSTLCAKPGSWTSGTTRKYQWYRSGAAIKGATSYKYKTVSADRGDRLRVRVTGSKSGYTTKNRYSDETRRL